MYLHRCFLFRTSFEEMTSEKVQPQAEVTEMEPQEGRTDHEPCWKKRTPEAGFLVNMKDHLDEFVNTSMDQHKICLKKTIRGVSNRLKKTGSVRLNTPSLFAVWMFWLWNVIGEMETLCHNWILNFLVKTSSYLISDVVGVGCTDFCLFMKRGLPNDHWFFLDLRDNSSLP